MKGSSNRINPSFLSVYIAPLRHPTGEGLFYTYIPVSALTKALIP